MWGFLENPKDRASLLILILSSNFIWGWQIQFQLIHGLALNVAVFGDRDFKDIIKVKWNYKSGGPNPIWLVSLKEKEETTGMNVPGENAIWAHRRQPFANQGEIKPTNVLVLDWPPSELWENKFLSFKPPSLWHFVWLSLQTKTESLSYPWWDSMSDLRQTGISELSSAVNSSLPGLVVLDWSLYFLSPWSSYLLKWDKDGVNGESNI